MQRLNTRGTQARRSTEFRSSQWNFKTGAFVTLAIQKLRHISYQEYLTISVRYRSRASDLSMATRHTRCCGSVRGPHVEK